MEGKDELLEGTEIENQEGVDGDVDVLKVEKKSFDPSEYLKGRFGEDSNPEEYGTKLDEMFDKNDEYGQNMKTMEEIFGQDNILEQVILNMKEGMPFSVALVKAGFTPDDFPVEGDDDYTAYTDELNSRNEKSVASKARLDELNANSEGTNKAYLEVIKELFDGDEEGANAFSEFIRNQAAMYNGNKMSAEDMKNIHRYMNIDKLIADANSDGEINGRNGTISEKRANEEMGDEIPDLTKGGAVGELEQPEEEEYFRSQAEKF